tara:strand:- start:260 stop:433 length:174 start_codon:yes stop_codon:yes gene_type:complete
MTVISNPDDVPAGGTRIKLDLKRFMTDDAYVAEILGEDNFNELLAMVEGILAEEDSE